MKLEAPRPVRFFITSIPGLSCLASVSFFRVVREIDQLSAQIMDYFLIISQFLLSVFDR